MQNQEYSRKKTVGYLLFVFVVAYVIQIIAALLYSKGLTMIGQLVIAAMMFVPMLGVIVCRDSLANAGWNPNFRKNIRYILFSWFAPVILTVLGAALYFLFFPSHFDISGSYLTSVGGEEALKQMEAQNITYPMYVGIAIIQCLTYAPAVNMLLALGEELGWRGFLYPQLKKRFGKRKGVLIGGVIWGMWHWPLIWLIGYEYGTQYIGFPVSGMLIFCIFTTAFGILCDHLYEKSKSIWIPALLHGSVNAAATLPLIICDPSSGSYRLLGPVPNGIISMIPLIITASVIFFTYKYKNDFNIIREE